MTRRRRPAAARGEKSGGLSTTAKIAIGCGVAALALVAVVIVASLAGATMVLAPRVHAQQMKTQCANRLSQLGAVYTAEVFDVGAPEFGGAPLLLSWYQQYYIQRGREEVLTCPGDGLVQPPGDEAQMAAWSQVDLSDAADVRAHCSFAVRDFVRYPVDNDSLRAVAIACDAPGLDGSVTSHPDGLNVLYNDGSVQFRDRAYLGLGPDDPIVIGPDSPIELLRPMVVMPGR